MKEMFMKYAIANQTAAIVRDGEIIRIKGDSMPVGRFLLEDRSFRTFSMPLMHGDMLYMFSDGIQDQVGGEGESRQRFTSQRLLNLLANVSRRPMREQLDTVTADIAAWQGSLPQIDDMTLVGIGIG
jgi:serine phosphatase RsbU (regulator of sigma subunit)